MDNLRQDQLIVLLTGPGGVGKIMAVNALKDVFDCLSVGSNVR